MSFPDGYNVGVCQGGEVGKGGVGHHCVHHGLGHRLAEGPGLGPLKDLVGREGQGLGSFLGTRPLPDQSPAVGRSELCIPAWGPAGLLSVEAAVPGYA